MRKLLFFLLIIPAFSSLGNDAYTYFQHPERGFRFSDLGALWSKHHKESHHQWKTKIWEFGKNIEELMPESSVPENKEQKNDNTPAKEDHTSEDNTSNENTAAADFAQGFEQSIGRDGTLKIKPLNPEDYKESNIEKRTRQLIAIIGTILEQKAILVLSLIPAFFFILNLMISSLFKEKEEMDKIKAFKKKKRKGGGYNYSRK